MNAGVPSAAWAITSDAAAGQAHRLLQATVIWSLYPNKSFQPRSSIRAGFRLIPMHIPTVSITPGAAVRITIIMPTSIFNFSFYFFADLFAERRGLPGANKNIFFIFVAIPGNVE